MLIGHHGAVLFGAQFHQLTVQLGLVQRFPGVGQLAERVGQLVADVVVPALDEAVAFGDQRREVALCPELLLPGIVQAVLHLRPGIHRRQRVDFRPDVQTLEILAHLLQGLGVSQPVAIVGDIGRGAGDRGGQAVRSFAGNSPA